jgi:hypothetical protein
MVDPHLYTFLVLSAQCYLSPGFTSRVSELSAIMAAKMRKPLHKSHLPLAAKKLVTRAKSFSKVDIARSSTVVV